MRGVKLLINTEAKHQFIELRANGMSFDKIKKELHISKDTCMKWDRELQEQISSLKAEQLNELYDKYYMTREARIKKLGSALNKIDTALEKTNWEELDPLRLLDMKLKYEVALKEEYIPVSTAKPLGKNFTENDVLNALADLHKRVSAGAITKEQAQTELSVLSNLLRAYETTELRAKLDTLEAIIGAR